jgi:hypothetical protein
MNFILWAAYDADRREDAQSTVILMKAHDEEREAAISDPKRKAPESRFSIWLASAGGLRLTGIVVVMSGGDAPQGQVAAATPASLQTASADDR